MKSSAVLVLLIGIVGLSAGSVFGQTQALLPDPGSYGVSFSLPSGGGAGFGVRRMLTGQRSLGAEIQLGLSWQDVDYPDSEEDSQTSFGIGVSPDLRLYRDAKGPVVPFVEVEGTISYQRSPGGAWGMGGGAGAGLGVEWIPLEGMSISGSTGIAADFDHNDNHGRSADRLSVGLFRSELKLNLYF